MPALTLCLMVVGGSGTESLRAADELTPSEILKLLGARGRDAGTQAEVAAYRRHFDRIDRDRDGRLSHEEYVENGTYLNPRSREGIFRASDSNRDGSVSRAEYVVNRRITDEAKAIMERADADRDRRVTREEFVGSTLVKDKAVAMAIFDRLDTDRDGSTFTPEYLRVWGAWARAIPPSEVTAAATQSAAQDSGASRGGPP